MKVHVKVLAVVVTLFLALGVSHGLVMDKCKLGDELNSTLAAKMLNQITSLVAKIVCHVELSSGLNTSTINYVTGPNIKSFIYGIRKGRSAESSSEESSEEDFRRSKSSFNSSVFNPVTRPKGNSSTRDEGHGGRKSRSAESSSEESSEEDFRRSKSSFNSSVFNPVTRPKSNSSTSDEGHRGRKGRSAESSSEESSEEDFRRSKSSFNSSVFNPVTRPKGNSSTSDEGHRGRKGRSAESSSEESSEEDFRRSKSSFNSSVFNPVTRPKGNSSTSDEGHRGRKGKSAESSSEESDEQTIWTLYGLFQLPDRIACTSGFEPSLNLCNMDCDSLIDDNLKDDITCVQTILNKTTAAFFQKECSNVENSKYFSTC